MRLVRGALFVISAACIGLLSVTATGLAAGQRGPTQGNPRVITDGRLRPGHLEPMSVVGFPGRGALEVSFFPGAICEDECGARSFSAGRTNARGAAKFRVRVPGTFENEHGRWSYFRDGERVEVTVTWAGAGKAFDVADAEPEPIIVRTHGSRHHD